MVFSRIARARQARSPSDSPARLNRWFYRQVVNQSITINNLPEERINSDRTGLSTKTPIPGEIYIIDLVKMILKDWRNRQYRTFQQRQQFPHAHHGVNV